MARAVTGGRRAGRRITPGAVVLLVLAAGVAIAAIVSTVLIPGNQVRTPQLTPVTQGLVVAVTSPCPLDLDDPAYSTEPVALFDQVELVPVGGETSGLAANAVTVCLGNAGGFGSLYPTLTAVDVSSDELPGWPDAAESSAGDTTGEPLQGTGELADGSVDLTVRVAERLACLGPNGEPPDPLVTQSLPIREGNESATLAEIPEGGLCRLTVGVFAADSDPSYLAGSTDTLNFGLEVRGSDVAR